MTKTGNEERYPLLLLYVEENGRKSEFPQRVVFADKGRGKEVIRGAAAIITQWPAQITSCWLTSVVLATSFIFLTLVILMSSMNPLFYTIHPRCTRDVVDYNGNKTIHLVKHGNYWSRTQLDILKLIADTYPDFEIRNIMLDTTLRNFKKREKMKEITTAPVTEKYFYNMHFPDFENIFVKKLSEVLKKDRSDSTETSMEEATENISEDIPKKNNSIKRVKRNTHLYKLPKNSMTYEDILNTYPNIREQTFTYKQYFSNTPLHYYWVDLSPDMIIFSVRILELWQNGGISFYIPKHNHEFDDQNLNISESNTQTSIVAKNDDSALITRLKTLINCTKSRYAKFTENLVSIDGQGLHIAAKVPCHSFFGEMIMKLQKNMENVTISDFIQHILNIFCSRGAVNTEFCTQK